MAGGLCTLALGAAGAAPAAPLVTDRMRAAVAMQVADGGAAAVRHQPLSGIPFKVYAAEAGRAGAESLPFLAAAVSRRGLRIATTGAMCMVLGVVLRRWPHRYPLVIGGGTAVFAAGLTLVVAAWTRRPAATSARGQCAGLGRGSGRPCPVRCDDDPVSAPPQQPRAVFRISPLVVLVALAVAVCATPVALAGPYLWLIYLVPVGIIVWTLRVRTVADSDTVTVRRLLGGRRLPWTDITSVHLGRAKHPGRARVSAVLSDGSEVALPAVHVRDLPRLAAVSGGRLPDPSGDDG
jgi:hypothetical protein